MSRDRKLHCRLRRDAIRRGRRVQLQLRFVDYLLTLRPYEIIRVTTESCVHLITLHSLVGWLVGWVGGWLAGWLAG